jgi:hypothetical protein
MDVLPAGKDCAHFNARVMVREVLGRFPALIVFLIWPRDTFQTLNAHNYNTVL